jgi:phthiocerol/phenolphthiocerol synthesis type-I polyketide synthase E
VTSRIKVVLSLQHELIPANVNFTAPNPKLPLDGSPFFVNERARPWPAEPGRPRLAGVNSLGVGGTNVHLVVGEAPVRAATPVDDRPRLMVWSGRSAAARADAGRALAGYLDTLPEHRFPDAVATLQRGRTAYPVRAAVVAASPAEASRLIGAAGDPEPAAVDGVGLLFPGQGAQFPLMGRDLAERDATFRRAMDDCLSLLAEHGADVRSAWAELTDEPALAGTALAQPLLFAVEYALAEMWTAWGVRPAWLLGHSVGELAAAAVAGVFELPAAAAVIAARAREMAELPPGRMLAVRATEAEVTALLPDGVQLAAVNGPDQVIVGGAADDIAAFAATLAARGLATRRLRSSHAFHTTTMAPALPGFRAAFQGVALRPPRIPVISAATGAALTARQATDPEFWVGQLVQPVRFDRALTAALGGRRDLVLETGPGRVLGQLARGVARAFSLSGPQTDGWTSVLTAAGRLWTHGVDLDWAALEQHRPLRRIAVPGYPYQRDRHWLDEPAAAAHPATEAPAEPTDATEPAQAAPAVSDFSVPLWFPVDPVQGTDVRPGDVAVALLPADRDQARDILVALRLAGFEVVPLYLAAEYRRLPDGYQVDQVDLDTGLQRALGDVATRGIPVRYLVHALGSTAWDAPTTRTADRQLAESFHSLLTLVRHGHRALAGDRLPDVLVLTRGSVDVSGAERLDPVKATMHGALLTLAVEEPRAAYKLVDLGGRVAEDVLVAELAAASRTELVALRGNRRWLRGVRPYHAEPGRAGHGLRRGGVYLISGGLGGLGTVVARALAGSGLRPSLVLFGRTGATPEDSATADAIAVLERMGAHCMVQRADVSDPRALRRVVDVATARFGPVNGVFHLAGVPGDGMLHLRSATDAAKVFAPKVHGTLALAEVFAGRPALDFFVAFSSRAAVAGHQGSGDYAAANAFLDAFMAGDPAGALVADGTALSVNWPAWRGVGMAVPSLAASAASVPAPPVPVASWSVSLRPRDCPALDEHRVDGIALLPGTGHLDLLVRAYRETRGLADDVVVRLRDVVFQRPFVVPDRLDWQVEFAGADDGFTVFSAAGGAPVVHVTGHISAELAGPVDPAAPGRADPAELRSRLPEAGPPPRRRTNSRMFQLGPRWSNVIEIAASADGREKLATLALPEVFAAETAEHHLHPMLLDSATSHARNADADGFYLPFSYGSVTVHGRLGARVYSHIRRKPGSAELIRADVDVLCPDGNVLVSVRDFAMRRIAGASFAMTAIEAGAPPAVPSVPVPGIDADAGARLLLRLLAARPPRQVLVSRHRDDVPIPEDLTVAVSASAPAQTVAGVPAPAAPAAKTVPAVVAAPPSAPEPPADPASTVDRLLAIFAKSLGTAQIVATDDFFELGGNSLTAVEVMNRVRKEFAVNLSIAALFDHPTIEQLAGELQRRAGA